MHPVSKLGINLAQSLGVHWCSDAAAGGTLPCLCTTAHQPPPSTHLP